MRVRARDSVIIKLLLVFLEIDVHLYTIKTYESLITVTAHLIDAIVLFKFTYLSEYNMEPI